MTLIADDERIEAWNGFEKIISNSLDVMSKIRDCYDLCIDVTSPQAIIEAQPIRDSYFAMHSRGVRVRIVTEITPQNLRYVKQLMDIANVRHLEPIVGNFAVADKTDYAGSPETENGILTKLVVSNVSSFVKQQQNFFEMLWQKAIQAELRIRQIEEGIEPEITEIVEGSDNISRKLVVNFSRARQRVDSCCDAQAPSILVKSTLLDANKEFLQRGGRIRLVTEITSENLPFVKELMKTHETRHLEGLRANFGVSERDFSAPSVDVVYEGPQFIFSNSKEIIKQHQYLFETLWNRAMPAEHRLKEIEEGIEPEITEVVTGWDNIFKKNMEGLLRAKERVDSCCDALVPSIIVGSPMYNASSDFVNRGGEIRLITEITPGNLSSIKELMKIQEIRHINGFKLNFGTSENLFNAPTSVYSISSNPQCIYSNSKDLIKQHQYLFGTLWEGAIPAESRIMELERGTEPEHTEVWREPSVIASRSLEILAKLQKKYDFCIDSKGPSIVVTLDYIKKAYLDIVARGGKLRLITEIISENISYCKEIAGFAEVRHLDKIKGNFGIIDEKIYGGTASTNEKQAPSSYLYSTVAEFVDQQQLFFETLWDRAIPAAQRIRELEEGKERDRLEIIQDTQNSISRALKLMNATRKELLILFATARTFNLALTEANKIYREMLSRGVSIRVLIPRGDNIKEIMEKVANLAPGLEIRISDADLNTRITIMVCDRKDFMSWQLRDDSLEDPYEAGGVATYSNISSLTESYATIFDNLWKITEFAENLRIANARLEKSEKSMKDFIDVAAHELRTPIQPIIGLTEVLKEKTKDPDQSVLFDAIIRNAERLQQLQEDILDVTKIESQLIRFDKQVFDIDEEITRVMKDVEKNPGDSGKVKVLVDLQATSTVRGDKLRIAQVILNLVGNSMKFTRAGTIIVRSGRLDEKVIVSVIDTGTGIDPEIMPRLFTKFAAKSPTGTGLGLFISKSIVEAHGGKIWASNNADGTGATFSFTLSRATN